MSDDNGGQGGGSEHRMYTQLAEWWPLLSAPADYEEEAGVYFDLLQGAARSPIRSLLELGSGGGNNALFLKTRCQELVLTDLSVAMIEVSKKLNPECEHVVGDMRSLRLQRTFDAVFVHDAVCHMTTEGDLLKAMETAWCHCRPGGVALFAPDYLCETFPGSECDQGGCDERMEDVSIQADGIQHETGQSSEANVSLVETSQARVPRGLRYLAWSWDPDPDDSQIVTDYSFLLREADGSVRVEHGRHVEGLFPRGLWLELLSKVGFQAKNVAFEHSGVEASTQETFVVRRPA